MKQLAFILSILCIAGSCYGAADIDEITPLVSGVSIDDTYLASGAAVYTDGIIVEKNVGYASVSLDLTTSSDLDLSFEVSNDGITYYSPKDTSNTDLGAISTAITDDRWIVFTPRMAKFMRFKLDPDADTQLNEMRLTFLKDNT